MAQVLNMIFTKSGIPDDSKLDESDDDLFQSCSDGLTKEECKELEKLKKELDLDKLMNEFVQISDDLTNETFRREALGKGSIPFPATPLKKRIHPFDKV